MPQLKPIVLELPDESSVTFNPVSWDGTRSTFVDAAATSISMKQRLTTKIRPAAVNNTGHVVETVLVSPIHVETPTGCCPVTGAPPVSSFNLRFTRGTAASDGEAKKLYDELVAYVQTAEFEELVMGAAYF